MVDDAAQAIYGWRGAKDVMTGFDGTALSLTRSFRFGPLLGWMEANRWLAIADDFHPPKDSDETDEHGNALPGPFDDVDAGPRSTAIGDLSPVTG